MNSGRGGWRKKKLSRDDYEGKVIIYQGGHLVHSKRGLLATN